MPRVLPSQRSLSPRAPDLSGLRRAMQRDARHGRRMARRMRRGLALIVLLLAVPLAHALAGPRPATNGCELVSVVDGDTLELACPGQAVASLDVLGLSAPPVLGAACLTEALWGLRARVALRSALWQAAALSFTPDPRGRLVLVQVDGVPLHRLIPAPPAQPCG